MSRRTLFVTATDTGAGKTLVAGTILHRARLEGVSAAGYKPVASGALATPQGLRNDDALALQRASIPGLDYAQLNPYCFEPPIAPHLAAAEAGVTIDPDRLDAGLRALQAQASLVVIEGAGGWQVPLNAEATFADWIGDRGIPVVLVVAMRLGCINHALLSAESIRRRTRLVGWIANVLPPAMDRLQETIDSLCDRLPAPLLGVIPPGAQAVDAAPHLDWPALIDRAAGRNVPPGFTPADAGP